MRCLHLLPFVLFALATLLLAQSNPPFFAPAVTYASGGGSWSIAVADVNGDGKPDLLVANYCPNNDCSRGGVGVLLGNGDGTFQPPVTYASGGGSIAVADVNGDRKPDLLVTLCPNNDCSQGGVGVLLGNGDGTFQPPVTYTSGGYGARSIAVADVNGDGKPDLQVANFGTDSSTHGGSVGILLGNGDGTFQAVSTYAPGNSAWSLAVADVNGDGKPDLLVAIDCAGFSGGWCYGGDGAVAVLLGNGDGTFQSAQLYQTFGESALSIAVGDLNGDGKPDLLAGTFNNYYFGHIAALVGNGDGTFQTAKTTSTPWFPGQLAVADFDLDGRLDAVGSHGFLFLGNGDGTFQAPLDLGVFEGVAVPGIAVADFNLDGKPDVAVVADTTITILLNITPPPYQAFVQPPINADGRSIFKSNRGVIPVKFSLTKNNASTCDLPTATIAVTRTAGGTLGAIDESTYVANADNGSNFRTDPTACQYVYNLAASSLGVGTYRVDIVINGTVVGKAVFALK